MGFPKSARIGINKDRTFILRAAAAALAAAILRLEVLSNEGTTRSLMKSRFDPSKINKCEVIFSIFLISRGFEFEHCDHLVSSV